MYLPVGNCPIHLLNYITFAILSLLFQDEKPKMLQAFQMIYETTGYTFENTDKVIRRFVNCFLRLLQKMKVTK